MRWALVALVALLPCGASALRVVAQNLYWWRLFNQLGGGNFFSAFGTEYDVMLFQECDDVAQVINRLGLDGTFDYRQGQHSVSLAWDKTRFDLIAQGFGYVGEDQPGLYGKRGVTWMRLEDKNSGQTYFFGSHHGPLGINTGGQTGGNAVAEAISSLVDANSQAGDRIMIGGDFNADKGSDTVKRLESLGYALVASNDWVDHIFVKNIQGLVNPVVNIISNTGSDHTGVKITYSTGPIAPTTPAPTKSPTAATCLNQLDNLATDNAGTFSCGSRINWLITEAGYQEQQAKDKVAQEFPIECGACSSLGVKTLSATGRTLLWRDEFEGNAIDSSKWTYDIWEAGRVNNELQHYTSDARNSYVENGELKIRAIPEQDGSFSSARLVSRGLGDFLYAYVEVKAKIPLFQGAWPAIWMLPTDWEYGGWPASGEIDVMEHVSCDTGTFHGSVHTEAYNHMIGTQKTDKKTIANYDDYHVYQLEWTPTGITVGIDGSSIFQFNNDGQGNFQTWPFDKRFHILLNIAVGGMWGGMCLGGSPPTFSDDGATNVMSIDYVRVYSHTVAPSSPTKSPVPTPLTTGSPTESPEESSFDLVTASVACASVALLAGVAIVLVLHRRQRTQGRERGIQSHAQRHAKAAFYP